MEKPVAEHYETEVPMTPAKAREAIIVMIHLAEQQQTQELKSQIRDAKNILDGLQPNDPNPQKAVDRVKEIFESEHEH